MLKGMRWSTWLVLAVAVGVLQTGCGTPPAGAGKKQEENPFKAIEQKPTLDPSKVPMQQFFPMVAGAKLTYEQYKGFSKITIRRTMEAPTGGPNPEADLLIEALSEDGKVKNKVTEHYIWQEGQGLSYVSQQGGRSQLRMLPAKWAPGSKWSGKTLLVLPNGQSLNADVSGTLVGVERIDTGIGPLDAVHTTVELSTPTPSGRNVMIRDFWFAKDIGLVKIVDSSPSQRGAGNPQGILASLVLKSKP